MRLSATTSVSPPRPCLSWNRSSCANCCSQARWTCRKAWRGRGIGAALIRAAVAEFRGMDGIAEVRLGAQTHALGFYAALGFCAVGPEYLDAGIAHRDMVLEA